MSNEIVPHSVYKYCTALYLVELIGIYEKTHLI